MPTNHAANIGAYLQTITLGMQSNEINKCDNIARSAGLNLTQNTSQYFVKSIKGHGQLTPV